jgi:N-acetylmuramoyl-L-alanine amidase
MFLTIAVILMLGQAAYAGNSDITAKDIADGLSFCRDYPVNLQVDGQTVNSDVAPVIIKERTLIPARAVFESMGADVEWDEATRLVDITLGSSTVKLTIDSKAATVNGSQTNMDVPAMIINDRTMIPLRFVSESLACGISWDDASRTAFITSPQISKTASIDSVVIKDRDDSYRVMIKGDGTIDNYTTFTFDNPKRFGIDIKNAELSMDEDTIDSESGNKIFDSVRYSQFTPDTVRVVVDLNKTAKANVSLSSDKDSIYIDFDKNQKEDYDNQGGAAEYGLDMVDSRAADKLVVIDPGHGGTDPGSQAIQDGVEILNEKDVNLDIALRLNDMLEAAGVKTMMTRNSDTTVTLYDRPAAANEANADLYVSVHNNSSESSSARGTEVYYDSKTTESSYGIYSKHLAEVIYANLLSTIGCTGRGAKSEPAYAVLNKTTMPAIIIEGAFLSNTDDLKLMMTDEFRQNYALAAAKGIIQILNESVSGQ